jgi:cytochrome c oxidase cbb3-type subunit 1
MFLDLTFAGLFQGYYWASLQPWDASLDGSYPFWMIRLFAGLTIIAGQLCFVVNLWKTWRLSRSPATRSAVVTAAATA